MDEQSLEESQRDDGPPPKPSLLLFLDKYPNIKFLAEVITGEGLEYFLAGAFVFFACNYLLGYYRNKQISQKWLDNVREILFNNFSVVGSSRQVSKPEEIAFE